MPTLRRVLLIVVLAISLLAQFAPAQTTTQSTARPAEPTIKKEDLPRLPAVEPADAIKTMHVRPGFHIELAAAEPNVIDPVAMCFDENGRMFVVEMRDYSERRAEKLGRIRMLEDKDGDGVYETSTIFLDHLPWPTALLWCNGGLLIGACPDILFAKDTNQDGVADDVQTVFTGFGSTQEKLNVQGLFNNFQWGPDNRIHGCSGHDGGMIEAKVRPTTQPLDVRNKGFVIDPRDWSITTEAGGGQYGLSFDQNGRLFTCENSSHCQMFMYDAKYAARNPYVTLPDPRISIAADGPAAEVFRASPEEPWRVVRTRWRVAGLVGGPVEGGGRSAGYFTGATGITIYRGDAFGEKYVGDAFIGDAGGNLVHHKHITTGPDGIEPVAARPDDEKKIEFCTSTDTWFRPVDFANAPDGCLYICDMYREVIEHPWSIPPQIKQFLDLNSGNDRGRIYRLAPDGFKRRPTPKLGSATTAELVALLDHPNGWHRETAARLLFERQDPFAVPLLAMKLEQSKSPVARMNALLALQGLSALTDAQLVRAIGDSDPNVQRCAMKLAESKLVNGQASDALFAALEPVALGPGVAVRYQLALTLGEISGRDISAPLSQILRQDFANAWIRVAVLSAVRDGATATALFDRLVASDEFPQTRVGFPVYVQLASVIGQAGTPAQRTAIAKFAKQKLAGQSEFGFAIASSLALGIKQNGGDPIGATDELKEIAQQARTSVMYPSGTGVQLAAMPLVECSNREYAMPVLYAAITGSGHSEEVRLAALACMGRIDPLTMVDQLSDAWSRLSPRIKEEASSLLVKRPESALALLQAIRKKQIAVSDLNPATANFLCQHPNPSVRAAAERILPPANAARGEVVDAFRPALDLAGDALRGKVLYEQRCISCHRAAGEGNAVGPDLVTVRNGGKEKLLLSILDPSREVAPNYVAYLIETKDGDSALGILASDTPTSITVRQAYAKETVIPRGKIKHMSSQGKSLMPDGLEVGLKPQDLADLIAFIESAK